MRFQWREHRCTYRRWFVGLQDGVDVQKDDLAAVFPTREEAEEYREWPLQNRQMEGAAENGKRRGQRSAGGCNRIRYRFVLLSQDAARHNWLHRLDP